MSQAAGLKHFGNTQRFELPIGVVTAIYHSADMIRHIQATVLKI